jgi:hypothetical protein
VSEPGDGAALVRECCERTLAASSARVEFVREFNWSGSALRSGRRRRGGLLRPLLKLLKFAGRTLWRRWTRGMNFSRVAGEGIFEPSNGRYMLDYGEHAEVHQDGESRAGRSGDPADTAHAFSSTNHRQVWWLLDALRGVTEATDEGEEAVRGATCRRMAARVDLSIASAATSAGIRPPDVERFEELLALPFTVWVDGTYVRRVRFEEGPAGTMSLTLELWDFGVDTTHVDWGRLPGFLTGGTFP